ncbi:sugar ABC transporter substrate-binding protein [Reticulibacter mediterranei]|uniref:Sugar ABC transporter substrate-binding protein n=1 Tax=Reticulibacter mediterranei TaxID=2778369 RepID=A0A8J3MY47_9CHLR|nr:substrate-binding domain-containing protein [Reticulibacter mediterranei]GHO91629.1 sugar ABC transporter substrate-binding protein [Reticulibacter mediterranei]
MQAKVSRRAFLEIAGATALTTSLAGCFGVGGSQQTSTGGGNSSGSAVTIWDIRTGAQQKVVQATASRFNSKHTDIHATINFFQNDPYKQKIQVAMGAHNPPDIFIGWGGGVLKSYIDANDVYDLTPDINADSTWKNRFLPSVLTAATFDGKLYGVPNSGVQPTMFYYNKDLFNQYHLSVPKTWNELLNVINTLKQHNVIPIALAGSSKWPYLMYEQYLVDRYGGPDAFNNVITNQKDAWSQDAFIKANTAIQQLVNAGAFGSSFSSVVADTNQDAALLYTGKAAMMLQGNWNFPVIQTNSPEFIQSGKLGWFPFPTVEGGKGDPGNIAGNPCNFYSISKTAKSSQNCVTFLKDAVLDDQEVKDFIAVGSIPAVQGIESQLSSSKNSEWLLFNYQMVQKAPHFQLSWDQALAPQAAQALLTNLDQLFLKQITPQQFSDNMNKTITAS